MPSAPPVDVPWYVHAFDRTWLRVYAERSDEEAERRADGIVGLLGVRAGERVLDVGCGAGRYARALMRRGLRVTGVDLSVELLEVARERGMTLPNAPSYFRGDMRRLPFRLQFEGAISMFTSLGYFETPEDDLAVFRGVRRALVPGGRFLLDYLNADRVRTTLVAREQRPEGPLRVEFERRIVSDEHGDQVVKAVRVRDHGTGAELKRFEERVRLYDLAQLDALLRRAGLDPVGEPLGDVDGTPFTPEAARLVRVARRS